MASFVLALTLPALACDSAPAGCDANWHCELVMDGVTGDASDVPVGVGIDERTTLNKVWFAINHVEDDDASGGTDFHNRVAGAQWTCNDNDCDCPTETVALTDLGIDRVGGNGFNTAPSIETESSGSLQVHVLAMEEDDTKACSGTDPDARYHEWVFNSDFTTTIAENSVDTDAQCDAEWDHGEIGYEPIDNQMFAGWTFKDPLQSAWTSIRGLASSWGSLTRVLDEGDESDHVAFAFNPNNGNERLIYHDFELSGPTFLDFGSTSQDIDLTGTDDNNWPDLMWYAEPTPDQWKAAFACTDGSSDPAICLTQCDITASCTTTPGDWDTSPDAVISRTAAGLISTRNVEILSASDGSQHLLWVDFSGASAEPGVWYARKCPGSPWITPVELWDSSGWVTWLDVGRPHMAVIDNANRKTVHIVFAANNLNPFSGSPPTDGMVIYAHREWTCN
jgi:hypothetical protein